MVAEYYSVVMGIISFHHKFYGRLHSLCVTLFTPACARIRFDVTSVVAFLIHADSGADRIVYDFFHPVHVNTF